MEAELEILLKLETYHGFGFLCVCGFFNGKFEDTKNSNLLHL